MASLKELKQKRGQIQAKLTRFQTYLDNITRSKEFIIEEVKLRLEKARECWLDYEEVQENIEHLDDTEESLNYETDRDKFENLFYSVIAKAEKLCLNVDEDNKSSSSSSTISKNSKRIAVKLPDISIPTFSGDYKTWMGYKDLFVSLIHKNDDLSDVQKLYYLRSSLKGDAEELIESLEIKETNYQVAWDLVNKRYENKKLAIEAHVKSIFDQPKIEKESAVALRLLLNTTVRNIKALDALDQPVKQWDSLLIHLIVSKFDYSTFREWQLRCPFDKLPTFENLEMFLIQRCQFLENMKNQNPKNHPKGSTTSSMNKFINNSTSPKYNSSNTSRSFTSTKSDDENSSSATFKPLSHNIMCVFCNLSHSSYQCPDYLKLSINERWNLANRLKLCKNCLRANHSTLNCKITKSCSKPSCSKRHHTTLHGDQSKKDKSLTNTKQDPLSKSTVSHCAHSTNEGVMLGTAIIEIMDSSDAYHPFRVLLDSGSQSNYISESMTQALGLKRMPCNISVSGIQSSTIRVTNSVNTLIKSRYNLFKTHLKFLVIPNFTNLPTQTVNASQWKMPKDVFLADSVFHTTSKIHGIIGAELYFQLIGPKHIDLGSGLPTLRETHFGWVVSGRVCNNDNSSSVSLLTTSKRAISVISNEDLHHTLTRFWSVEEIETNKNLLTPTEQFCEDTFSKTTRRLPDGRFEVSLPKSQDISVLGESQEIATKRFLSLERKLNQNHSLKSDYSDFLNDYLEKDHMEEVPEEEKGNFGYYLPHHAVIRECSSTTKLRVVFDASIKTTNNNSLNDILLVGPPQQRELFSIIYSFRFPKYVFTTDIKQMFRQIRVKPEDCDLQRILWRDSAIEPIKIFRLLTVTYGTSAAPYLSTRSLHQLALEGAEQYPIASKIIDNDCYVDDILSGFDTIEETVAAINQLIKMLDSGGFKLHKWVANHDLLLQEISSQDREQYYAINDESKSTVKTLGLIWEPVNDSFMFKVPELENRTHETKRTVLSDLSKLFDPLGLIGPIVIRAKLAMQFLWKQGNDWDDPLNPEFLKDWVKYVADMASLNTLSIPRRITNIDTVSSREIHGFCDASEQAYGSCVYVRSISINGEITSNLLCAKSRVAPLKKISLPRLELCGAVLLSNLIYKLLNETKEHFDQIYLWTDSSVVLSWIKSESHCWKTFVANRIAEIHRLSSLNSWNHVDSESNPADILSRGCTVQQLIENKLWWHGPDWLIHKTLPVFNPNVQTYSNEDILRSEAKRIDVSFVAATSIDSNTEEYLKRFSSYPRAIRVTAFILRFFDNTKFPQKRTKHSSLLLSKEEFDNAKYLLLRRIQEVYFSEDLKTLSKANSTNNPLTVKNSSKIKSLNPFLDQLGLIRVGGRIENALISYNHKHPIIMPDYKCHLSILIGRYYHQKSLHSGPQLLLATIRSNFWPIHGKVLSRKIVNNCVVCFRAKPKPASQLMGDIPHNRVQIKRPFLNVGVDFFGPLYVKRVQQRKTSPFKIYVALFVCYSSKAIHLEIVQNLTTEEFIACLKRFIARRGYPEHIYCDNATTFKGTDRELKNLIKLIPREEINRYMNLNSIKFSFIPARSPTFGGIWESGVKSVKHHLKRVIGNSLLTFDKLYTLLAEVEACVNSRPLVACSQDPNDLYPLTPGHFLIGEPLTAIPESSLSGIPTNTLSNWQHIHRLKQTFWKRWSAEYLSNLQARYKWRHPTENLQENMLVILKEDFRPPMKWETGRITQLYPGRDGKCRVVAVKTKNGIVTRAITKICPIPIATEEPISLDADKTN